MIRYIFIDDAAGSASSDGEDLEPLVDNVEFGAEEFGEELCIDLVYPEQFDEQITFLRGEEFDGLILDLRLDEWASSEEDAKKTNYRATGLAQEIRTRATEGNMSTGRKRGGEFPLVLWSYDQKLTRSYKRDESGHDLFDLICSKEELEEIDNARDVARKLVGLSEGYKGILDARKRKGGPGAQFYRFLGFAEDPGFLDPRLLGYFEGLDTPIPAHEYARFIVDHILEAPGPLLREDVLAARLGIDVESSDQWEEFLEVLADEVEYSGPFHQGWRRWWAYVLEEWWESEVGCDKKLRLTKAKERVDAVVEATSIGGLVAAEPISEDYSTSYWTVCWGDSEPRDPLDPIDGLKIKRRESFQWQDDLYISKARALEMPLDEIRGTLDPVEIDRLEELLESQKLD